MFVRRRHQNFWKWEIEAGLIEYLDSKRDDESFGYRRLLKIQQDCGREGDWKGFTNLLQMTFRRLAIHSGGQLPSLMLIASGRASKGVSC